MTSRDARHSEPTVSMVTYVLVFISLMVLLVATVWVALLPWDKWGHTQFSVVIALIIAIIKASLVIFFFMHVKLANRLTQMFVAAAFVWLGIMFVFSFQDYLTRNWLPNSAGWYNQYVEYNPSAPSPVPSYHVSSTVDKPVSNK